MITVDGKRLKLSGPVTLETHVLLREESTNYVIDADVEIDLSDVVEVDSSALALIFFWRRCAGKHAVTLINPPNSLLALADLYGVNDLLASDSGALGPP